MFRVSSKQLYMSSEQYLMNNTMKLNKLNHQISTGKQVNKASDDPVLKRKIMHEAKLQKEAQTYKQNISDARNQLETAESSLNSIHDILDMIKIISLQMANDTVNEQDREIARNRVLQAREDIISYANTEIDGFYVFGGYRTAQQPFTEPDGIYQGDEFARSLEIAPAVYKKVAFPGSEMLQGIENGVQTGVNVLDTITQLAEDLLAGDGDQIRDRISEIDDSLSQVGKYQSEAGTLLQEVEITNHLIESNVLQSQIRKSNMEDLDISSAVSEFETIRTSLEATMATTSKVLKLSLLDYMR